MRISPELLNLVPYRPGKPISETLREYNLKSVIKLASNENPLGPSPLAQKAVIEAVKSQHLYPDPTHYEMLQSVSKWLKVPTSNLGFGNGSDELIDLLCRIYCEPGQSVLTIHHAFAAYEVSATANRARVVKSAPDQLVKTYFENRNSIRILFIPNPNNPTGSYLNQSQITELVSALKGEEVLIVFDEAYNEFARAQDYRSAQSLFDSNGQVIILRTFSKAYGLAGFRVGAMLAPTETIEIFNRVRKPFNVNDLAQVALVAALQDESFMKKTQEITWKGLDYFYQELQKLELPYFKSEGNFVLFDTLRDAQAVDKALLKRGLILRPVLNYGFPQHLRMSVGLENENRAAIEAIKQVLVEIPQKYSPFVSG
ncbi:MAG: histidinol-phosphate transaminase [Bdellovibrionales bacterium]